MAVLAGCDYAGSLPGMGIKSAFAAVRKYARHGDARRVGALEFTLSPVFGSPAALQMLQMLRLKEGRSVSTEFETLFEQALLTFRHQRVYDARTKVQSRRLVR